MCGIFAFINYMKSLTQKQILEIVINGLRNLQYRGHDSMGVSFDLNEIERLIVIAKTTGSYKEMTTCLHSYLANENSPVFNNHVAIAHTRWATHGRPAAVNAHPQPSSPSLEFVVVHNGSIDNNYDFRLYLEDHHYLSGHPRKSSSLMHNHEPEAEALTNIMKKELTEPPYHMNSETDTEVLAKFALFTYQHMKNPTFPEVIANGFRHLVGSASVIFKSRFFPDECVACRYFSPLVLGFAFNGEFERTYKIKNIDGLEPIPLFLDKPDTDFSKIDLSDITFIPTPSEVYVASDAQSFSSQTHEVMYLENWDIVHITPKGVYIFNIGHCPNTERKIVHVEPQKAEVPRKFADSHTLSEIYQQPEIIQRMVDKYLRDDGTILIPELQPHIERLRSMKLCILVASGSSYNAVLTVRTLMDHLLPVPVFAEFPSEMNERTPKLSPVVACIFVSQSGETADTVFALREARSKGAFCIAITNTRGSTITTIADLVLYTDVGIERGVASTKTYSANVMLLTLVTISLATEKPDLSEFRRVRELLEGALDLASEAEDIAEGLAHQRAVIACGRGTNYAVAREMSMKLRTLAYIHSESFHEGELKHGAIALIEEDTKTIFLATTSALARIEEYRATLGQITARGGFPIVITDAANAHALEYYAKHVMIVPKTVDALQPLVNVIPMQLIAYFVSKKKGIDCDKPRNLAKCATII